MATTPAACSGQHRRPTYYGSAWTVTVVDLGWMASQAASAREARRGAA